MSGHDETTLELSTDEKLDDEITKLKSQVESLKRDLQLHTTTLLASEPVRDLLRREDPDLAARADEQEAHRQQCLYRACATATMFRVRDPDPHAVDGGAVLGVRVEVMSRARFIRPYFVMLNRPYAAAGHPRALRVHRHTVPPCVPLAALAARYLPAPGTSRKRVRDDDDGGSDEDGDGRAASSTSGGSKQDLPRFVRALRRELVRYHNRVAVIGDLRKAAGLEGKRRKSREAAAAADEEEKDPASSIVDVSAADAEAKQIRIEWGDGKSGRLVMNDEGEVLKMVVQGANGQDREAVRQFLGGAVRIEEVSKRL